MAKDTKERILTAALEMFSQKGYDGTNIRELTSSLGLVKSALYRHFGSKEEIWNALLDEMIAYYGARFGSPERLPPVPDSPEELVALTMGLVDFTIHQGHVHPPLRGHDGQGSPAPGRPRDAGLCLHRAHLRPHSPVRSGAGKDG